MSGACSTHRGEQKCIQSFGGKPEGDNLEEIGVDRLIKIEGTVTGWEDEEWIDLALHALCTR
jgi:hypothetical protein